MHHACVYYDSSSPVDESSQGVMTGEVPRGSLFLTVGGSFHGATG